MASDLISRDALLDSLEEAYKELKKICDSLRYEDEKRICNAQLSTFAELTMRVRKAPTVDAEPVRHAEWIPCVINGKETKLFITCSGCRRYQWPRSEVPLFRRCPKYGAIMGGSKRD